jgi:hypothetical protein
MTDVDAFIIDCALNGVNPVIPNANGIGHTLSLPMMLDWTDSNCAVPAGPRFLSAADHAATPDTARAYITQRYDDARELVRSLADVLHVVPENQDVRIGQLYGAVVFNDRRDDTWEWDTEQRPHLFATRAQLVAWILATYW